MLPANIRKGTPNAEIPTQETRFLEEWQLQLPTRQSAIVLIPPNLVRKVSPLRCLNPFFFGPFPSKFEPSVARKVWWTFGVRFVLLAGSQGGRRARGVNAAPRGFDRGRARGVMVSTRHASALNEQPIVACHLPRERHPFHRLKKIDLGKGVVSTDLRAPSLLGAVGLLPAKISPQRHLERLITSSALSNHGPSFFWEHFSTFSSFSSPGRL